VLFPAPGIPISVILDFMFYMFRRKVKPTEVVSLVSENSALDNLFSLYFPSTPDIYSFTQNRDFRLIVKLYCLFAVGRVVTDQFYRIF